MRNGNGGEMTQSLGFLVLPGFPMACLTSAIEPLRAANEITGKRTFQWQVVGETGGRVESSAAVAFEPDLPLYMGISLGPVVLHLTEHYGDCAPGARVIIETTGLAVYQAGLLAKRYGYARPGLERQPWGATTMTVTDPFHNWLVFTEREVERP